MDRRATEVFSDGLDADFALRFKDGSLWANYRAEGMTAGTGER